MHSRCLLQSTFRWALILIFLCKDCCGKRYSSWDYEPVSLVANSVYPDKLSVESKVERVGRGEHALSGKFVTSQDFGETVMVEAACYISPSGSEDEYKMLPWSIEKQSLKKFADSHYKEIIYPNVKECSNLPVPEKVIPLPKNTYTFDKCVVTGEGLPHILPEGYYKIVFNFSGDVECEIVAIVKIITRNSMVG